jgi:hypothetical protein
MTKEPDHLWGQTNARALMARAPVNHHLKEGCGQWRLNLKCIYGVAEVGSPLNEESFEDVPDRNVVLLPQA